MDESTPSTEIALRNAAILQSDQAVGDYFAGGMNTNNVATNIPLKGREGLMMQMRCTGQVTREGESLADTPFPVKYFYAHVVEPIDPSSGEVQRCIRVVFVSPDYETTSFTSEGVIDSLDMIRRSLGDGPYDPPLNLKLVRIKTRHKRTVFHLEILAEDKSATTPENRSGKNR